MMLILGVWMSACVTPFTPKGIEVEEGTLVVEGDIVVLGDTKIYLSMLRALDQNYDITYISNALVWVENNDGDQYHGELKKESNGNSYFLIDTKGLGLDHQYKLGISFNGMHFESDFLTPLPTPAIDALDYALNESKTAVDFYVTTFGNDHDSRFFKWNFTEDWEVVSPFQTLIYFDPVSRTYRLYPTVYSPFLYCWNQAASTTLIAKTDNLRENTVYQQRINTIENRDDRISYLYSMELSQMSITKEAYTYWSVLKRNSDELGGIFAPQPSELYGNIRCLSDPAVRVLGYVSAGTRFEKRIFATSQEIGIYIPPFLCPPLDMEPPQIGPPPTLLDFYNRNYRVVGMSPIEHDPEDLKEWYPRACVECTARGTKIKPPFWPNDHF